MLIQTCGSAASPNDVTALTCHWSIDWSIYLSIFVTLKRHNPSEVLTTIFYLLYNLLLKLFIIIQLTFMKYTSYSIAVPLKHFKTYFCRMLEDDLKISSDEEDNEQVTAFQDRILFELDWQAHHKQTLVYHNIMSFLIYH